MKELPSTPPPSAAARVLYVEDEDENWEVVLARLGSRYTLERARSAEEAWAALHRSPQGFAVILMDIQLKGSALDGVELTRLLRGKLPPERVPFWALSPLRPAAPIFFVTAYGSRYSEQELRAAGAEAIVSKPVDFVKLSLTLAQLNLQRLLEGPTQDPRLSTSTPAAPSAHPRKP